MTKPDRNGHQSELSLPQLNAVDLLATGLRDAVVAERVGVSRQTVNGWRNHDVRFQAALNARRAELWGEAVDRLRALLPKAVEVLATKLEQDPRIALEIFKTAGVARAHLATPGPTTVEDINRDKASKAQMDRLQDLLVG